MLRMFCVALSLFLSVNVSVADALSTNNFPYMQVNDSGDFISETDGAPEQSQRVRPQRYICVIDQTGSIGGGGQVSCPAKPGRVGGRCRCSNVTGSGTLLTY